MSVSILSEKERAVSIFAEKLKFVQPKKIVVLHGDRKATFHPTNALLRLS